MTLTIPIAHTWDGTPVPEGAAVQLARAHDGDALLLRVLAPFYADPPPNAPPGATDRLWEHEVVELFLAGPSERYLEVELGPHGHHLVLQLDGVRRPVATGLPLHTVVRRAEGWWVAEARIPRAWVPDGPHRLNAHRIHGEGSARRYLAHAPAPGDAPDFHRLEAFVPVVLPERPSDTAADWRALRAVVTAHSPAHPHGPPPADISGSMPGSPR